ncbi:MAG: hypothetical protein KGZ61_13365 [Sandarakinorhabdus sp.]|nr:hypothetical protein [Sandarakinorhabdus sp.]
MPPKFKSPTEKTVRTLLDRYACPVSYHEVRTRLLGNIASPDLTASPMRIIEGLWGGELPVFDNMADANELIDALVQGLWNDLAKHQKRSHPFRLIRLNLEPSAKNLAQFAEVRRQELEGFVEGLFNGQDRVDLPERAHKALKHLGELRATMAGIEDLVARDIQAESRTRLETTFKHASELTKIMETEIHEAVMSCARARRQMLAGIELPRSSLH